MMDATRWERKRQHVEAPIHGGGVIIHDAAPVEREVCIMNDAAPTQSDAAPAVMSAVANTSMLPTTQNGSRMLLMTLMTAATFRRTASIAGLHVPPPDRRPRAR